MKITLSLIGFIIMSGSVFSQTTRQTNETPDTKEIYYVLKSDKNIKEGSYRQYRHFGNKLICEGFYKNDQRDSLWVFYSYSNHVSERGAYKEGKKTGVWDVYNSDGEQEIKYDYTNGKLLFFKKDPKIDTIKASVINGTDTIKMSLNRAPIYLDGTEGMFKVVTTNQNYPVKAKEANVQGKVTITFTIDSLGKTSNYKVRKGIGSGCDEEALRVVKLIDGDWLPGLVNDKPVAVEYLLQVNFIFSTD
jgi:TonB family protein